MKLTHYIYRYLRFAAVAIACAAGLSACYDDLEYVNPDGIPEGSTTVTGEIDFMPMAAAEMGTRASNALAGDGLAELNDLAVLVFDKSGHLNKIYEIPIVEENLKWVTRKEGDAMDGKPLAETQTRRYKFQIPDLPFGEYHIYGVANIGKYNKDGSVIESSYDRLTNAGSPDKLTESINYGEGTSIEELASLKLRWDDDNWQNNGGMLGWFTTDRTQHAPIDWRSESAVKIVRDNMTLHSWLRRAASKVTIDFDPSGLRDNIKIWIRKAQICDIPQECNLGMNNTPGKATGDTPESTLVKGASQQTLYYSDDVFTPKDIESKTYDCVADDYLHWPMLQKGTSTKLGANFPQAAHNEKTIALYFYENLQGTGRDKRQFPDENGAVIGANTIKKDEKPYGTYIEVEAYYQNLNPGVMSQGKIIYRFMLGQNETTDYNATRNHHYKVTMKFKGNANDVDWHIEYSDPEPIVVPVPYYISYLYNHDMKLPLKMQPEDETAHIIGLSAEITRNDWWPAEGNTQFYYTGAGVTDNNEHNRAHGFLSLKPTHSTRVDINWIAGATRDSFNELYYYDKKTVDGAHGVNDKSRRDYNCDKTYTQTFTPSVGDDKTPLSDEVVVTPDKNGNGIEWQIPLYTRAKQLVKPTGYTGNNPYVGHYRFATVKFTARLDKTDAVTGKNFIEQTALIRQVERIVNPKGIYRKWNSREPFQVTLKKLKEENSTLFENYISDGPWRAYIVRGDRDFIDIGRPGMKEVSGSSGTPIDFSVRFKGSGGEDIAKNCVIRVEYNNYSCVHLIFVRQGYKPQKLFNDDVEWHIANMRGKNDEAVHPCDEGSMFKFGNWDDPIDVGTTVLPVANWALMTPTSFKSRHDDLDIYHSDGTIGKKKWLDINHLGSSGDFNTVAGNNYKVASTNAYYNLRKNPLIENGYGVLYADGATKTADTIDLAYGYNRSNGKTEGYGIRGVFCYSSSTDEYGGRSIFFPIGNTGYGLRKDKSFDKSSWNTLSGYQAVLRYAGGRSDVMPEDPAKFMPLLWDLYRKPGAIYWANKSVTFPADPSLGNGVSEDGAGNYIGLDINYFSFDFTLYYTSNMVKGAGTSQSTVNSNACFVRCVN